MEENKREFPSLPKNYVTLVQLQERWMKQKGLLRERKQNDNEQRQEVQQLPGKSEAAAASACDASRESIEKKIEITEGEGFKKRPEKEIEITEGEGFKKRPEKEIEITEGEGFKKRPEKEIEITEGEGFKKRPEKDMEITEGEGFKKKPEKKIETAEGQGSKKNRRKMKNPIRKQQWRKTRAEDDQSTGGRDIHAPRQAGVIEKKNDVIVVADPTAEIKAKLQDMSTEGREEKSARVKPKSRSRKGSCSAAKHGTREGRPAGNGNGKMVWVKKGDSVGVAQAQR